MSDATMRAVLKTGAEKADIVNVPRPTPAASEVLIRIHACAICASDLGGWTSPDIGDRERSGWNPSQPGMTGHEYAGVVEAVGPGVPSTRVGERVWVDPIVGCGDCPACAEKRYNLCAGAGVICGGYADYVTTPTDMALPIPDGVDMGVASMISDMMGTPMGASRRANIQPGETVAVWGLGPVGLGLAQGARIAGATTIIGVDLYPNRRELALELAATHVVDPAVDDPVAYVRELTGGRGADVVLHSVAAASASKQALDALRLEGRMVTVAGFPPAGGQSPKSVIGNWACYHADFPQYIDHLVAGEFRLDPYVTHTFPMVDVEEAFHTRLHKPEESLKVIVEMV
jgi:(R,R)-butanediol dehydrogenase / meso-butanediol dehydrogenase / diacetyl reductase